MAATATTVNAQQLHEKITDDFRFIQSPTKDVEHGRIIIHTTLSGSTLTVQQDNGVDTIDWSLLFSFTNSKERANIDKNSNLLLKLSNGEVIKLRASLNSIYNPEVSNINGLILTTYRVSNHYPISQADLERIIQYGVIKLRAETSLSPVEKEWKKDRIGSFYGEYYEQIKQALSVRKSFDTDF